MMRKSKVLELIRAERYDTEGVSADLLPGSIKNEIGGIKKRLEQLECPHENAAFREGKRSYCRGYPDACSTSCGADESKCLWGRTICVACDKVLATFVTEREYLAAKLEYNQRQCAESAETVKARLAELKEE